MSDHEIEERLRGMAAVCGVHPEKAVRELRHGGALAQIIRRSLGGAPKQRGRPPKDDINWRRFCLIVTARRNGSTRGQGSFYERAAALVAREDEFEPGLPDTLKAHYAKMKRRGWTDSDVPEGLAAFFSSTPPDTDRN